MRIQCNILIFPFETILVNFFFKFWIELLITTEKRKVSFKPIQQNLFRFLLQWENWKKISGSVHPKQKWFWFWGWPANQNKFFLNQLFTQLYIWMYIYTVHFLQKFPKVHCWLTVEFKYEGKGQREGAYMRGATSALESSIGINKGVDTLRTRLYETPLIGLITPCRSVSRKKPC